MHCGTAENIKEGRSAMDNHGSQSAGRRETTSDENKLTIGPFLFVVEEFGKRSAKEFYPTSTCISQPRLALAINPLQDCHGPILCIQIKNGNLLQFLVTQLHPHTTRYQHVLHHFWRLVNILQRLHCYRKEGSVTSPRRSTYWAYPCLRAKDHGLMLHP